MPLTIPVRSPNGLAEIIAHYGDPKVTRSQDGEWTVDSKWESANMASLFHPLLPRGRIYCHRLVADPLKHVLGRWNARVVAGDAYKVQTLGCFAPRAQRGSNGLLASTHTWGIAFDLNADTNRLISPCDPDDARRHTAKDIPDAWIDDAEAEGWTWGGAFQRRYDPMHFQLATGY